MGQCTRTAITAEVLISYNTALFHKKMLLITTAFFMADNICWAAGGDINSVKMTRTCVLEIMPFKYI